MTASFLALATSSLVAQDMSDVEIQTQKIANGIHVLEGRGGNIGVCVGSDGAFLVDDQFAPLSEKILAAVRALHDAPPRFVLNTHWHGDHTGGNENLGKKGLLIVAHDNVRVRMSTEQFSEAFQRKTPASPAGALPVVTFESEVTFHLNGEEIHAFHVANAHTDGDAIVHFRNANVIHGGDVFWNGHYPYIDVSAGGSINGMIDAAARILELCDAQTQVVPGHGAVAGRGAVQTFHDMLVDVRASMRKAMAGGKSLEQVAAAKPTAKYDEAWGTFFIKPDKFVEILYSDLSR